MAISITRFVDILSGVGGAASFVARLLIGRLFSSNILIPTNSFVDFDTVDEVGEYFGTSSEEYGRAVFYFGFISKLIRSPQKITFARWIDVDVAPLIFGGEQGLTLAEWQAITDGSFTLEMGAETNVVSGIDFSGDASLADVAATLQTEIQTAGGIGVWTAAAVTYDAVKNSFNLVGGATGVAPISVSAGGLGTEIQTDMGWGTDAILSAGAVAEEPVDSLTASANVSDNFGSFLFMDTLTLPQIVALAQYNQSQNLKFMYMVPVIEANSQAYYDDLKDYAGSGLTLISDTITDQYPEMIPMMVLAATDYNRVNATQNYMFQQASDLSPTVADDTTANELDALRINYYGVTQQAGQNVSFYQRGFLMGSSTAPSFMNTYANEIWFKDAVTVALLNRLLALKISANEAGKNQVAGVLQGPIDSALDNGTISTGRELTNDQKAFITTITGDDTAYHQVQNLGYWVSVAIEPIPATSPTEYQATYLIVYAKDDAVNKIDGTHTLT